MKKIALLGLLALVVAPLTVMAGDQAKLPEGQAMASIEVSGMTCGGCCKKVETAVNELDGIVKVKADYEKGITMVVYEPEKVELDQIIETINTKTSFKAKAPEEKTS